MSFISAGNTTTTTLLINGDTTGNLVFNTGGANTTALTITNTQAATFANNVTITGTTAHTGNASFSNITATGSVGIGTATPAVQLDVYSATTSQIRTSSSTVDMRVSADNGTGAGIVGTYANKPVTFYMNSAEKARIDTSGRLLVGLTGDVGSGGSLQAASSDTPLALRNTAAASGKYWRVGPDASSNNLIVYNQNGTGVYITDGGTTWSANSDERLKTDLTPIVDGLAKVNSLRSVTGRYKTDEEGKSRAFLIAQDVQKVLPEAIAEKDGYLGVGYTETIPLLVAAIKELNAKVDAQAAEIAALKAGA